MSRSKPLSFIARLRGWLSRKEEDPREVIARLLLAARDDDTFRRQVLLVLCAPSGQRQSLVNTAIHEMTLRGESTAACAAFATLATDEGAKAALAILNPRPKHSPPDQRNPSVDR